MTTAAVSTQAYANNPEDFLIRDYAIFINIENLPEAMARLNAMSGFDLNTSINTQGGWGHIERRVDVRDLDRFLEDMQYLGRVTYSSSRSRNVFSMMADLRSEQQVRNTEHARLMELLVEVETMAQFATIENRLLSVISEMEWIRGRLNNLEFETGTARIMIELNVVETIEPEPEPGPFARIGQAFVDSAGATLAAMQWIVIALISLSMPLLLFALGGGLVALILIRITRRIRKRKRKGGGKNETTKTDKPAEDKDGEDNES